MATINIQAPTLGFGATSGIIKCQVDIVDNGTPTGQRIYYFNPADFSAYADQINLNYASLHFGAHELNLSNGNYTAFAYGGSPVASAYDLVTTVADYIADNL